jgi:hypothetical protein
MSYIYIAMEWKTSLVFRSWREVGGWRSKRHDDVPGA